MLTVSLTAAETLAGVLVTVSTVSVTGAPPEPEPPPEDPPDEDEPPEVEPDDPEALADGLPALFEPPELALEDVPELEFEPPVEEEVEDEEGWDRCRREDDSSPTVVGIGGRFDHGRRAGHVLGRRRLALAVADGDG